MSTYILVFIGGGLGSVCRLGVGRLLAPLRPEFPWATFTANVAACLLLGVLVGMNFKGKLLPSAAVFLMGGFCGGFSTFSAFSNETFQMLVAGDWGKAAVNIFLSLAVCLVAIYAGIKLGTPH